MFSFHSYKLEPMILIPLYWNRYMVKEKDRLFQREYENAPLNYQNIARS